MKVKLRIESQNKVVNEINKNINSIMDIVRLNIYNEAIDRYSDTVCDSIVDGIINCIKSDAAEIFSNIIKIVKEQKAEYKNKITYLEEYIRVLESTLKAIQQNFG